MPTFPDSPAALPLGTRLWFAWVCLIRVLFDPTFAAKVWAVRESLKALPGPAERAPDAEGARAPAEIGKPGGEQTVRRGPAARLAEQEQEAAARAEKGQSVQLLTLLQREGRFVDFLEQDVTKFTDEEVGAAARIVHEGCRKVLHRVTTVSPIRTENEGARVVIEAGFSPTEITLVGNVQGAAPYRGTLRHRGWRVGELNLPETVKGHDLRVLAPAEVEI